MADKNVLKLVYPGKNGVRAVIDFTKINQSTEELKKRVEWLESGSRQFALKDYSKPENQGEMVVGVYYYVAFTKDGTFVQADEFGKPQGDAVIDHFDIYMKSTSGTVTFISRQYTDANLQDVAYTNKLAVFEAGIQKKTPGVYTDLDNKDLVAKGEIDPVISGINADIDKITNVIGENAENAALITKENTFQHKQHIALTKDDTQHKEASSLNGKSAHFDRATAAFDDDSTESSFGVFLGDKTNADVGGVKTTAIAGSVDSQIYVQNADGTAQGAIKVAFNKTANTFVATAPSTADSATGQEIVTADWANKKISAIEGNLQDATDTVRGFVKLSDAVDSDSDAPTGKTAATPKAVKTVNDALVAVTGVIGANAEHAALINKANVFAESQTIKGKDNTDSESGALNFQASTFKNADNTFTGTQTSATLATNLTAGDDNTVISTVEHVVDATNRTINVAVVDDAHARHGLTIQSNHAGDAVSVVLTDSTPTSATGKEVVTADYVAKKIGTLDPEHVAYTNKDNQFTENQTLIGKLSGTDEAALVTGKSANFDYTAKSFENSATSAKAGVVGVDKNGKEFGAFTTAATATAIKSEVSVKKADGTVVGTVGLNYDLAGDKVRAHAPTPDITNIEKDEILTAGLLNRALTGADDVAQLATTLQDLRNVAYVNKANTFTAANVFQSDKGNLTIGDGGVGADDGSDLILGAGTSQMTIASDGHITRPEMPQDAGDTEVTTKKYVDSQISKNATPDATTDVKGKVELATDEEVAAGTDGVVPTAKQVRSALDGKIAVITDESEATAQDVLYIVIEA